MKKNIGVLLLIAALILSGCTEKLNSDMQSSIVDSPANVNTNIGSDMVVDDVTAGEQANISNNDYQMNEDDVGTKEWCIPGSKITANDKEYTIIGIVTYKDKEDVCRAERPIQGGNSTVHFNKEYINKESGAFFSEKSISVGKNARAEASSSVSTIDK